MTLLLNYSFLPRVFFLAVFVFCNAVPTKTILCKRCGVHKCPPPRRRLRRSRLSSGAPIFPTPPPWTSSHSRVAPPRERTQRTRITAPLSPHRHPPWRLSLGTKQVAAKEVVLSRVPFLRCMARPGTRRGRLVAPTGRLTFPTAGWTRALFAAGSARCFAASALAAAVQR